MQHAAAIITNTQAALLKKSTQVKMPNMPAKKLKRKSTQAKMPSMPVKQQKRSKLLDDKICNKYFATIFLNYL